MLCTYGDPLYKAKRGCYKTLWEHHNILTRYMRCTSRSFRKIMLNNWCQESSRQYVFVTFDVAALLWKPQLSKEPPDEIRKFKYTLYSARNYMYYPIEHAIEESKGHLTINRASFPSILIICSTNHIWIKLCINWVEKTSYLLVSALYMCTKSYSTRFLCFSLYFLYKTI